MKSYVTFLSRNKLYTAIQFFGLSVALGFVILLAAYARTEFSVGASHPYAKEMYAVGYGESVGMTLGMGPEFFPSMPEVKEWTRLERSGQNDVQVGEDYYEVSRLAVDSNFFRFFHFETRLKQTMQPELRNRQEVMLSESFARKVFGGENPLGRTLKYNQKNTLTVVGVMEDFGPEDVWEPVDILVSSDFLKDEYAWMDNFGGVMTVAKLAEGTSAEAFQAKMLDKYCAYWENWPRENNSNDFLWGASLTRWDDLYFSSLHKSGMRSGNRALVQVLLLVALVLLISAVFNYINLTVAQTGKRAHEMATRRLLGDSAGRIVGRYLQESFLFTFSCGVAGIGIAVLLKPYVEQLLSAQIVWSLQPWILLGFIALLAVIALISGWVPALIMARFQPLDIVKGNFRLQNKQVLSRVFIVAQHIISTVLIAMGLTMAAEMHHLATLPMGYNMQDIAFIQAWQLGPRADKQTILKERLRALPQVAEISLGRKIPLACGHDGVHQPGEEEMSWLNLSDMDSVAFRILDFQVVERYSDPLPGMLWVTEDTRDRYGISAEKPYFDDKGARRVCGVIKDYRSLSVLFTPMADTHCAIQVTDPNGYVFTHIIRTQGNHEEALKAIRETCHEVCREIIGVPKELKIEYMEDYLRNELTGERKTMTLVLCFMLISILISALGLLAMSVSYTEQQSKRVALCKVMGASTRSMVLELSRNFMLLSGIATLIAVPIGLKAMQHYLEEFYYRIDFPWHLLVIAVLLAWLISFVSIVGQTWKVARRNPIESIKTE